MDTETLGNQFVEACMRQLVSRVATEKKDLELLSQVEDELGISFNQRYPFRHELGLFMLEGVLVDRRISWKSSERIAQAIRRIVAKSGQQGVPACPTFKMAATRPSQTLVQC